jgi:HEAT repeat
MIPKSRPIGLAMVLLMLCGLGGYFTRTKEPVYQGKTLTAWIVQYHRYSNAHSEEALQEFKPKVVEAEKAIRAIGTNAIPFLLQKLTAKNSRPIMAMNELLDRQSLISFRFSDAQWERTWAYEGFEALGEAGRPACPELFELLNDPNPQVRYLALEILQTYKLGPPSIISPLFDPITLPPPKTRH